MQHLLKRTWAEIDLDALEFNYKSLKAAMPEGCGFVGVVKADSYGHGSVMVSKVLEQLGARYLAVSNIEEAIQLRNADIKLPILILGFTPAEFADELADYGITQAVNDVDYAKELNSRLEGKGKKLTVHIKADTGMSRMGFTTYGEFDHSVEGVVEVSKLPNLDIEGIFTHFAVSDDTDQREYTELQYGRFMNLIDRCAEKGITFRLRHCANSGCTINYPEKALDMFRPGLATYGLYPADKFERDIELRPLMSLRSSIAQIKEFEADVTLSYGRTYTTPSKRRIAVIPIGYADGYPRRFSNSREFLVCGKRAPQVGRVCMDMCMLDITDVPEAKVGDVVTIFGRDGDEFIPMDDLANQAQTITYEIACDISKRVPRLYLKGGEVVDVLQYIV